MVVTVIATMARVESMEGRGVEKMLLVVVAGIRVVRIVGKNSGHDGTGRAASSRGAGFHPATILPATRVVVTFQNLWVLVYSRAHSL